MRVSTGCRIAALTAATALVASACAPDDDEEALQIGQVVPQSGDLAFLGPPQEQALRYAMHTINEAGGVLGEELPDPIVRDETEEEAQASEAADEVLRGGAHALIGAAASGMSLAFVDRVNDSGVVQCSGSNTAPTFTDAAHEYYFRTAPSDALQGLVLGERILEDGYERVSLAARADDYGRGLLENTAEAVEEGGGEVVATDTYDPDTTDFSPVVSNLLDPGPDAVVVVGFEEGAQILRDLVEAGASPEEGVGLYGADGLNEPNLGELVSSANPGAIEGMVLTAPSTPEPEAFLERLQEFAPDLDGFQFAPQVFDCVTIVALAAEAAGSTDPTVFVDEMIGVTRDGTECTSFEECRELIEDGEDINYNGVSGPLEFSDVGEPSVATIGVFEVDDEGTPGGIDSVDVQADE
ncbi:ABC transporter substrate-binding protein [Haloechinothrix sp. LS1_15]|uniref:ABC transporter substrate-binding protein n=1 Tax=Haloechinothrix sp. LS1_15 TaxID=2652248 RepID=UPI002947BC5A|nr:ABC transporter substrate-binding protein [Haloechinothrix sp. LS1_15]MDV6012233.1 ABC transporter substrate-binding protein [Haloechinothrix sp. LS1_15]